MNPQEPIPREATCVIRTLYLSAHRVACLLPNFRLTWHLRWQTCFSFSRGPRESPHSLFFLFARLIFPMPRMIDKVCGKFVQLECMVDEEDFSGLSLALMLSGSTITS